MVYTIVVKHEAQTREYNIYTEPIYKIGDIADSIKIEDNKVYAVRKLQEVDGEISLRPAPVIEFIQDLNVELFEGTNIIYIKDYQGTTITAEYLLANDFTDTYPTRIEMETSIKISADSINSEVKKKVDKTEIISTINQTAEAVTIDASKINLNGVVTANQNFKILLDGTMQTENAIIQNSNVESGKIGAFTLNNEKMSVNLQDTYTYTENDLEKLRRAMIGAITLTPREFGLYDLSRDGALSSIDLLLMRKKVNAGVPVTFKSLFEIITNDMYSAIKIKAEDSENVVRLGVYDCNLPATNTQYLKANNIQNGITDSQTIYANTVNEISVFQDFKVDPTTVIATPISTAGNINVTVENITKNGFTIYATTTQETQVQFSWIAMY